MLVDKSSGKRFGEGPKGLRKIGGRLVFDSIALSFSFLFFLHSQGYHHTHIHHKGPDKTYVKRIYQFVLSPSQIHLLPLHIISRVVQDIQKYN